jgi:hypothetical protein
MADLYVSIRHPLRASIRRVIQHLPAIISPGGDDAGFRNSEVRIRDDLSQRFGARQDS